MHARRILPALAVSAALAAAAAPAVAAQTDDYAADFYNESTIIVTESRSIDDAAINARVVDALRNDSRLAGRIGVQTLDREVELSGIVTSPGQWRQAERDAMSVYGVRNVRNLLSARIGAGRY
jgi:osmotically-inducible protein OsmY